MVTPDAKLCPFCKKGVLFFAVPITGFQTERICNNCGYVEDHATTPEALALAKKQQQQ